MRTPFTAIEPSELDLLALLIHRARRVVLYVAQAPKRVTTDPNFQQTNQGIVMKKKPALFAVGFMESDWVRYLIQDERGKYWTGQAFSKDKRKALAYADETVLARDMRRILKRRSKELVRHRFVAPVMIDVYAEGPLDQEELAWFLRNNCFVSMDGLGTGVGPGDSVVLPVVEWEKLRMMRG